MSDDFWQRTKHLPQTAPSRSLHHTRFPGAPEWTTRLTHAGIDPTSASSIIGAISARGWSFWLVGSTERPGLTRYRVMILDPRYHAVWARSGDLPDPVSAFAQVMAICLENPPWEPE